MKKRNLNIFCPTHHIRLPVVGPDVLSCDNGPHVLSENFPLDFLKYCCDCDTFSPLENGNEVPYDHCPVCKCKLEDHWYLCENCRIFTTRPDDVRPRQKFYLPPKGKGAPQPFCPGCELETDLRVREHICQTLLDMKVEVYVATPRSACPLCREKITLPATAASAAAGGSLDPVASETDPAEGLAPSHPPKKPFWLKTKRQWSLPEVIGLVLAVMSIALTALGLGYTIFAHALPSLWSDIHYQYRKRLSNSQPEMKLAEPIDKKYVVLENRDAVLRAVAVDTDGDDFKYDWKVLRSSALIDGNGNSEVTLKTQSIHPEANPVSVLVRVKAVDAYGAKSESLEIELSVTTENLSNRPPVIERLDCGGCPNWVVRAGALVDLHVTAGDPDGDTLKYYWQPQGLINGSGPDVSLDTSSINPREGGNIYVSIVVTDERSKEQPKQVERQLTILARQAPDIPPPPATPPYELLIVDLPPPEEGTWVNVGDVVTLTASIRNAHKDNLTYEWKTSTNRYEKTDKAIYTFRVEDVHDSFVDVTVFVTDDSRSKGSAQLRLNVRQPAADKTPQPVSRPAATPAATPRQPATKAEPDGDPAARASSEIGERSTLARPQRFE